MSEVKLVKVDNWGIYFLQRLKHFFNRTDYCDLTLQFQDNAQLKVHRLVLSACTEYFELLERTCEMYEDCLVMPDDLQADVVVPIVNFMYTGQLEFKMDLLEKLYQTSEIMSMPVLTKLLDSHRPKTKITHSYSPAKRTIKKVEIPKEIIKSITPTEIITSTPMAGKRSYSSAFEKTTIYRDKKVYLPVNKHSREINNGGRSYREPSPIPLDHRFNKKVVSGDPRPTRYELPEELDTDNIFENSFCNISYTSQPLMVHPETRKQYSKRPRILDEASGSKKLGMSTVDIVECKKSYPKSNEEALFEESVAGAEVELYSQFDKVDPTKDTNQLFDQMLEHREEPSKITVETKNTKSAHLDHAKIISEVLKKYPHLVQSNKNIKLKILNTPKKNTKKQKVTTLQTMEKPVLKTEKECDYTFETDVIDSKQAAKLIALGAENIDGPWICLICGTPGKAMNFTSYYKFRRHLVEVHHEKPVQNICEYCGHKSTKRNYLLHHLYTKHGVEPPPQYNFPKCSHCSYVALTEALLVKHKASHSDSCKRFRCNVCPSAFNLSSQLLAHIQNTGHKYGTERKINLQCIYCQKVFMREGNLCSHLKAYHKFEAIRDGIVEDSDDEQQDSKVKSINVKSEPCSNDYEELDIQYQIEQRPDGNIHVVTKKANEPAAATAINSKQKILNSGLSTQILSHKKRTARASNAQTEYIQEINDIARNETQDDIVMIDNNEYIIQDNQLFPRRQKPITEEYILADNPPDLTPTTSMDYTNIGHSNVQENIQQSNVLLKSAGDLTEPIPIYVSNEEEYKALMASNQPIIVDSNDPNKILSVLTAPHPSTLETTSIDLDNTQSSDMMIIQDDFPLNVTEAVATDNSNIVVVYSHQVGDQNKQFQLLTSQSLEAQFVQSSTILTQNFGTITTSTPVISTASVGDKQEIWHHGNIHQMINNNEIEITPITSIQTVGTNQMHITNTIESDDNIDELPNVQLSSTIAQTINTDIINDTTVTQGADVITEVSNNNDSKLAIVNNEEQVAISTQNVSSMEVDEQVPIHSSDEAVDTIRAIDEQIPMHSADETDDTSIRESDTVDNIPNASVVEHEANETAIKQVESEVSEQEPNSQPSTEIATETMIQSEEVNINNESTDENVDGHVPEATSEISNNTEQLVTESGSESDPAIQTSTSQLPEEDNNIIYVGDGPQELNDIPNNVPQISEETCEEVEESIENIQQEVDKQMAETTSTTEYVEEDVETNIESTSQNESEDLINTTVSSQEEQEESDHEENIPAEVTAKPDPIKAQEKISSLLNDWEDSQEDNNSVPENVIPTESVEISKEPQLPNASGEDSLIKENDKQDNIKSLVSDWDEDEEENKD